MANLDEIYNLLDQPAGTPLEALAQECKGRIATAETQLRETQSKFSKKGIEARLDKLRKSLALIQSEIDSGRANGLLGELEQAVTEKRAGRARQRYEEIVRLRSSLTDAQRQRLSRIEADASDAGINVSGPSPAELEAQRLAAEKAAAEKAAAERAAAEKAAAEKAAAEKAAAEREAQRLAAEKAAAEKAAAEKAAAEKAVAEKAAAEREAQRLAAEKAEAEKAEAERIAAQQRAEAQRLAAEKAAAEKAAAEKAAAERAAAERAASEKELAEQATLRAVPGPATPPNLPSSVPAARTGPAAPPPATPARVEIKPVPTERETPVKPAQPVSPPPGVPKQPVRAAPGPATPQPPVKSSPPPPIQIKPVWTDPEPPVKKPGKPEPPGVEPVIPRRDDSAARPSKRRPVLMAVVVLLICGIALAGLQRISKFFARNNPNPATNVVVSPPIPSAVEPSKAHGAVQYAELKVTTFPEDAMVQVDDGAAQMAPQTFNLSGSALSGSALSATVTVKHDGYTPLVTNLFLRDNEHRSVRLTLVPYTSILAVSCSEADARIYVNEVYKGVTLGTTAVRLPFSPVSGATNLQIRLEKAGFQAASDREEVRAGDTASVFLQMKPVVVNARLRVVTTPVGASVSINGSSYQGTTSSTFPVAVPASRSAVVRVHLTGYQDAETNVGNLNANDYRTVDFGMLTPLPASLLVRSEPSTAEVYIGNRFAGQAGQKISVPGGTVLNVRVRSPGYGDYETNVNVAAGQNQVLDPIVLPRSFGRITVRSQPPGRVSFNGGDENKMTPCTLDKMPLGQDLVISVSLDGYVTTNRTYNLTADNSDIIADFGTLQQVKSGFITQIQTGGTKVFNGVKDGVTRIIPGSSKQPAEPVYTAPPETQNVPMAPGGEGLVVEVSPANAQLLVDFGTQPRVRPDGMFELTDLAPGDHKITVQLPGYVTQMRPVKVVAGQRKKVTFNLARSGAVVPGAPATAIRSSGTGLEPSPDLPVAQYLELYLKNLTAYERTRQHLTWDQQQALMKAFNDYTFNHQVEIQNDKHLGRVKKDIDDKLQKKVGPVLRRGEQPVY